LRRSSATDDDGAPLGSAESDECQIDSLVQSWAVISGAGDPARARAALGAADTRLVDEEAGLIKLFTPPFNATPRDPGYIKGYVPGVRENGGQYTHAALWLIWAYALEGDGARAGALLDLINPIRHASDDADRYMVEPYVIAADVYAVAPHTGRGGWTWYTGSAGWMYRLGVEVILGLQRAGETLRIAPCIPPDWPSYTARYRYGATQYMIRVENPCRIASGVARITLDGAPIAGGAIPLCDDGLAHAVVVTMGEPGG
jgi:cyclic beta-1,2-glucan synthetase